MRHSKWILLTDVNGISALAIRCRCGQLMRCRENGFVEHCGYTFKAPQSAEGLEVVTSHSFTRWLRAG
jgi:hypothetical protein